MAKRKRKTQTKNSTESHQFDGSCWPVCSVQRRTKCLTTVPNYNLVACSRLGTCRYCLNMLKLPKYKKNLSTWKKKRISLRHENTVIQATKKSTFKIGGAFARFFKWTNFDHSTDKQTFYALYRQWILPIQTYKYILWAVWKWIFPSIFPSNRYAAISLFLIPSSKLCIPIIMKVCENCARKISIRFAIV